MSDGKENKVAELMRDNSRIEAAMEEAVCDNLREHKLLGLPIVVWRDGKVVWVPPEEIEIPEPTNGSANGTS